MRFFASFIAVGLVCSLALPTTAQEPTSPAAAQAERGDEVLGTLVHGNTTIVFESAGTHGIDSNRLLEWDQFAEGHPKIATALAYKPSLINDSGYLSKHPELATFFQAHPDIKDAMEEKRDEARTMLAEVYNSFTEGFDTADLKEAKALLDELGA
jgi:hypothetical protein